MCEGQKLVWCKLVAWRSTLRVCLRMLLIDDKKFLLQGVRSNVMLEE